MLEVRRGEWEVRDVQNAADVLVDPEAMDRKHGGKVVVFVQGYNNSYQEAVFRLAQLSAGGEADFVPILFSWPSQAELGRYVSDRMQPPMRGTILSNSSHL